MKKCWGEKKYIPFLNLQILDSAIIFNLVNCSPLGVGAPLMLLLSSLKEKNMMGRKQMFGYKNLTPLLSCYITIFIVDSFLRAWESFCTS